ncbi:MAG TPA: hypothetical protein DEP32_00570, partial [Pseudomonas sp.]|nr:hypothetical protein [Pseudomonas sp.]
MVQAGVLAELAWSVENMLNRVMDRSISTSPELFRVVNEVRALMPQLVEHFAAGQQRPLPDVERLAAAADALARGETPTLDALPVEAGEPEMLDAVPAEDTLITEAEAEA